ncbi:MAG: AAA family ATPase [Candidatus Absconditabacterales bacterium]|nr:AAA family ATPase [Candidatus Absconditabacterales bacterium]
MNKNIINLNLIDDKKMNINTSEKSKQIQYIQGTLSEIKKNIEHLTEVNNTNKDIYDKIKKEIFDIVLANEHLAIEINSIQSEIKKILLNTNPNLKINLHTKKEEIDLKKNEIETNTNKIETLSQKLNDISKQINNIENEINIETNDEIFFSYLGQLVNFKEPSSKMSVNDLIIKPEGIKEFVDSYQNKNFPKDLLDKVVFFKGNKNTGKHSVIKALANDLNRPVFRVKYDDYFNEEGLYVIFGLITSHLRQQREKKNGQIEYYNQTIEQIKKIKDGKFQKGDIYSIQDFEGNNYDFDMGTQRGKQGYLVNLEEFANNLKYDIDLIEDSCVLYIDDLDRIIQSSKYEKGDLLGPIKMVIDDIKNEKHDIMLILVGNDLGTNHNDFKLGIDRVFQFDGIEKNYQGTFEQMLKKKLEKLNIKYSIGKFSLNNLEKKYRNIKFLDKLVKRVIKNYIGTGKIITQEKFDLELNNLIEGEKSLYNGIGLK